MKTNNQREMPMSSPNAQLRPNTNVMEDDGDGEEDDDEDDDEESSSSNETE
jgi:hypothetical protein